MRVTEICNCEFAKKWEKEAGYKALCSLCGEAGSACKSCVTNNNYICKECRGL